MVLLIYHKLPFCCKSSSVARVISKLKVVKYISQSSATIEYLLKWSNAEIMKTDTKPSETKSLAFEYPSEYLVC